MAITILILIGYFMYFSDDVDFPALEAYLPVGGCEQRIVPAHADVGAGEELRAALSYDN